MISSAQIHLYLALFLHRDYFFRPDSSLSYSFLPQGLLLPPGFISILLFSSAGMISSAQMHLYLALFHHRDYFFRPVSSPTCFFLPQGLFPPPGFISILLFFSAGIISAARIHLYLALFTAGIISAARIHPQLAFLYRRDDFFCPDSSLSCSSVPQGLFPLPGFIPSLLFCAAGMISSAQMHPQLAFFTTGIISTVQIHPYLALFFRRDYF